MSVNGDSDAIGSDFLLCRSGVDLHRYYRNGVRTAADQRQELPHGAAMSLGEFQEDMRVGESLPLGHGASARQGGVS
jgi:hypothetical protein